MKKLLSLILALVLALSLCMPASAGAETAQLSPQKLNVDGSNVDCKKYNIGGSNFFKLRDLGGALGFIVDFDADSNTAIVESSIESGRLVKISWSDTNGNYGTITYTYDSFGNLLTDVYTDKYGTTTYVYEYTA